MPCRGTWHNTLIRRGMRSGRCDTTARWHLVDASPHPASACALVELCHRVGKGGQQQAARRGEHRGRVSGRTEPCSSRAKSVTQGEFDGTRAIQTKRDRSFIYRRQKRSLIYGVSVRGKQGIGGSGRPELDRVEAPSQGGGDPTTLAWCAE